MTNIFKEYTLEELQQKLRSCQAYLKRSRNLVRQQGGWMMWNSSEEERQERFERQILCEIGSRQNNNS